MICRVWASSGPNGSSISRISGSRISICASADALALAARELVRIAVAEGREPDAREPVPRPLARLARGDARGSSADGDVVERRLPRHQRVLLEEVAGAPVEPGERRAEDLDRARRRRQQAGRDVEQRGLAAAGRADDGDELAGRDGEIGRRDGRIAPAAREPERDRHAGKRNGGEPAAGAWTGMRKGRRMSDTADVSSSTGGRSPPRSGHVCHAGFMEQAPAQRWSATPWEPLHAPASSRLGDRAGDLSTCPQENHSGARRRWAKAR